MTLPFRFSLTPNRQQICDSRKHSEPSECLVGPRLTPLFFLLDLVPNDYSLIRGQDVEVCLLGSCHHEMRWEGRDSGAQLTIGPFTLYVPEHGGESTPAAQHPSCDNYEPTTPYLGT